MQKILISFLCLMVLSSCSNLFLAMISSSSEVDPDKIQTSLIIEQRNGIHSLINGEEIHALRNTDSSGISSYEITVPEGIETHVVAWPDEENAERNIYYSLYNPASKSWISLGSNIDRPNGVLIEMEKTSLILRLSLSPY